MLEQVLGLFVSRSPAALEWLSAVGQEYERRGFLRASEWMFRQVVRMGGPSSKANYHLGRVLAQRGKFEEAKRSYALSLELKPDFYLCRLGFFELCRRQYWTSDEGKRVQLAQRQRQAPQDEGLKLAWLHQLLAAGLTPLMRAELARLEEVEVETSIYDRLQASTAVIPVPRRVAQEQAEQLERSQVQLEEARQVLQGLQPQWLARSALKLKLFFRKQPPLTMVAPRDGDDTLGPHLEVISGGLLSFIPFDTLAQVELGLTSEFTEATLTYRDGDVQRVVVPTLYFGSLESGHAELARGEYTLFKELYPGIRLGIGRKVLTGRKPYTGAVVAVPLQDVLRIELEHAEPQELLSTD